MRQSSLLRIPSLRQAVIFAVNSINKKISLQNQKRNYSNFGYLSQRLNHTEIEKINNILLNPWYVTGFSDAEASFTVTFAKREVSNTGYFVQPSFQIHLGVDDLALLEKIKTFFHDAGTITKPGPNSYMYRVRSLNELNSIIIPHFTNYPLITQKQADFQLFTQIVDLLNNGEHLTMEGLIKIASIKASMNKGLTEIIKTNFPNITPSLRNNIESKVPNLQWFVGFVEGEGSFWINITRKTISKVGGTPTLVFQVNQHSRDANLINSFVEYLGCGRIKVEEGKSIVNFQVSNFTDLTTKILPIFNKYPLYGVKALNLADLCQAAIIIQSKNHLTNVGMEEILKLKATMNRKRK